MNKQKIAIIGTAGIPAKYGGFETMAHRLVEHLADRYDITVYCSGSYYPKDQRQATCNGARLTYIPLNANGAQSIPYDILSMVHAVFYADILLVLGVSGAIMLPIIKFLFPKKKVVVSIDGIEWRREKWQGWIKRFLKWSEELAIRYSDADITDNEAIKQYTARRYRTVSHLIEYGADHAGAQSIPKAVQEKYPFIHKPYAFKVCRIEPENNLNMILDAFSRVPEKTLVVVGNWNNSAYGKEIRARFSVYPNLYLLDPIYNQEQLDMIRSNCFIYVHGHSAGGTNPSLVEAMYLGLPVFAFDVSFNKETTEHRAEYFKDADELVEKLHTVRFARLMEMRSVLKEIATRRYHWLRIAQRYHILFSKGLVQKQKRQVRSPLAALPNDMLRQANAPHLACQKLYFES